MTPDEKRTYHRLYMRKYHRTHPQTYTPKQRARKRARQQAYDKVRAKAGYHTKHRYGISLQEYDAMLAAQGGHCVFCAATCERGGKRLSVDHDKVTKRVRGILCRRHNSALGTFGDTEAGILRALAYLRGSND